MDLKQYIASFPALRRMAERERLGQACGVSEITVRSWANGNRRIPAEKVLSLELATEGQVSRHVLRPDVYPPPMRREGDWDAAVRPGPAKAAS